MTDSNMPRRKSDSTPMRYVPFALLLIGIVALVAYMFKILPGPHSDVALYAAMGCAILSLLMQWPGRGASQPNLDRAWTDGAVSSDAAEQSEHLLSSHALVNVVGADGLIQDVSDYFAEMVGYPAKELIGSRHEYLFQDGMADENFRAIRRAIQDNRSWKGVRQLKRKNDTLVNVDCTVVPILDEAGELCRVIAVMLDLSTKTQAANDSYVSSLLDEFEQRIYIYTAESRKLTYANRAALAMVADMQGTDWKGSPVEQFQPALSESFLRAHVEPLTTGGKNSVNDEVIVDGATFEIVTRTGKSIDNDDVYITLMRDISALRQVEMARMESVSEISHELRAPLTSIKGALRLLQSGATGEMTPDSAMIVDIATRNTEKLLSVVNNILDLYKFQMGKVEFDRKDLDLLDFLKEAVAMNAGFADEHEVRFVLDDVPETAKINGNDERLQQVMTNLLSNAAKYSPPGGDVRVFVTDEDAFWRISVQDNGPGLPDDARDKIFSSFAQHAPEDGKARAGTGLGLSITREIVQLHHGKINFDSVVGEGSTFYFELPKVGGDGD